MEKILAGLSRFQHEVFPKLAPEISAAAMGPQRPRALFITCSDSRVTPHLITQTDPGDLFGCQVVGNIVPAFGATYGGVSATVEYALTVLEVPNIIVCGHSDCGAMKVLLDPSAVESLPSIRSWINHAEVARLTVAENWPDESEDARLRLITEQNVVAQLVHLRTHPAVASRLVGGRVRLHGWVYELHSGTVRAYDESTDSFVPVEELANR
jgi:carbonic anhydrase